MKDWRAAFLLLLFRYPQLFSKKMVHKASWNNNKNNIFAMRLKTSCVFCKVGRRHFPQIDCHTVFSPLLPELFFLSVHVSRQMLKAS